MDSVLSRTAFSSEEDSKNLSLFWPPKNDQTASTKVVHVSPFCTFHITLMLARYELIIIFEIDLLNNQFS